MKNKEMSIVLYRKKIARMERLHPNPLPKGEGTLNPFSFWEKGQGMRAIKKTSLRKSNKLKEASL